MDNLSTTDVTQIIISSKQDQIEAKRPPDNPGYQIALFISGVQYTHA